MKIPVWCASVLLTVGLGWFGTMQFTMSAKIDKLSEDVAALKAEVRVLAFPTKTTMNEGTKNE